MREEFWDTEPHYGGDRGVLGGVQTTAESAQRPALPRTHLLLALPPPARPRPAVIWDALRAACEADPDTARVILDSAGVIVAAADMTVVYDERGSK